jgi:hypothetical protein
MILLIRAKQFQKPSRLTPAELSRLETLQPDMRPERWTALNVCLIVQTDG